MAVSFDLFGTLVTADQPADPAAAVARALAARGVSVPDDWATRYAQGHVDVPEGGEVPLDEHVRAALLSGSASGVSSSSHSSSPSLSSSSSPSSSSPSSSTSEPPHSSQLSTTEPDAEIVREAVVTAFDPVVETRPNARDAVEAIRERGERVAICSNCSVPGLVERTLARSQLEADRFDAVVTSVDCGWRKPAPEIFLETADRLEVDPAALVHVGDDARTDGGIERVGATAVILSETSLADLPARLEAIDR